MKLTKIVLCAAVAGAMTLTASKVSAFSLKLTSASGTLNTTAYYGSNSSNTTNKVTKSSYNLKDLLMIITNQITINSSTATPKAYDLMYDPYTYTTYLTNNLGYYYDLSGIADVRIRHIATSFKGTANGGSETDSALMELDVYGHAPDGLFYEAEAIGTGTLTANLNSKGIVKMTLSLKQGSGYGEFQGSDDGTVSNGQFTFSGSGTVPQGGLPYSVYWWNN